MKLFNKTQQNFQNIVRSDLLLKNHYNNIMEIPKMTKVIVSSQVPSESVKQMILALEILCGQTPKIQTFAAHSVSASFSSASSHLKVTSTVSNRKNKSANSTSFGQSRSLRSRSNQNETTKMIRCCLRKNSMHNWIQKMTTVFSFYDYTTSIHENFIQLTLKPNFLRLFPEIQNQIELFFYIQSVNISIFTSAKSVSETRLFWKYLLQKEI